MSDPTTRSQAGPDEPGTTPPVAGPDLAQRLTERAWILVQQGRFDLAEQQVREALVADPRHPGAHRVLAFCLSQANRHREAVAEARAAVAISPDDPLGHYVLGAVLLDADQPREALAEVNQAIAADPRNPGYLALLGGIHLRRGRAADALAAAEQALAIDAEDADALRVRQLALTQLGRTGEAQAASQKVLATDPGSALSHASTGWQRLHARDTNGALESFREALRIDPTLDNARAGLVEAMKGRNPIYGVLLRYFLWVDRLGPGAQLAVAFGFPLVFRFVRGAFQSDPLLRQFTIPLLVVYSIILFTTWLAEPLFDLVLRLDPFGRHALDEDAIRRSNVIGGLLLGLVAGLAGAVITGLDAFLYLGIGCLVLCLPVAVLFGRTGRGRTVMYLFTITIAGAMLGAVALAFQSGSRGFADDTALLIFSLAAILALLSTWVNVVPILRQQRS